MWVRCDSGSAVGCTFTFNGIDTMILAAGESFTYWGSATEGVRTVEVKVTTAGTGTITWFVAGAM